jgi:hypothetical protein
MRSLRTQEMLNLMKRGTEFEDGDGELALTRRLSRLIRVPGSMTHNTPLAFQNGSRHVGYGVETEAGKRRRHDKGGPVRPRGKGAPEKVPARARTSVFHKAGTTAGGRIT